MSNQQSVSRETARDLIIKLSGYQKTFKKMISKEMNDDVEKTIAKAEDELWPSNITKLPNLTEHAKELMDFVKETPINASYVNDLKENIV